MWVLQLLIKFIGVYTLSHDSHHCDCSSSIMLAVIIGGAVPPQLHCWRATASPVLTPLYLHNQLYRYIPDCHCNTTTTHNKYSFMVGIFLASALTEWWLRILTIIDTCVNRLKTAHVIPYHEQICDVAPVPKSLVKEHYSSVFIDNHVAIVLSTAKKLATKYVQC